MQNGASTMMIELLDKSTLRLLNKTFQYPLAIAEKDYFLALVSKIIYDSPLRDTLIFKGGTALHHTYLPQLRFSEDLDFSTNCTPLDIEKVKAVFADYEFLFVKKEYTSNATVKIERLQFMGPLGQLNSMKVEIDFLQNVLLPPRMMKYQNVYGVDTFVRVMDPREIAAEKIRAMNDRIRYRDFYDFTMMCLKLDMNLDEVVALLQEKEVRKTIRPQNIVNNWQLARKDTQNEIVAMYYSEPLEDNAIMNQLKRLQFEEIEKQ